MCNIDLPYLIEVGPRGWESFYGKTPVSGERVPPTKKSSFCINARVLSLFFVAHTMADDEEGLVGLKGLHQDLLDLDQGHRMRNIDRLWASLEARVNEFRQLLDKPSRNEESRKTLLSGNHIPPLLSSHAPC